MGAEDFVYKLFFVTYDQMKDWYDTQGIEIPEVVLSPQFEPHFMKGAWTVLFVDLRQRMPGVAYVYPNIAPGGHGGGGSTRD